MAEATTPLRIRDLFDLPERVVKNDFVIRLHDGIKDEEGTLKTYVATPRIVKAFEKVLGLVKTSLESGTSQGAYLHGSFGSGKSHFMAVLDLLLADKTRAWERREFHDLRAAHTWVGKKKLLILPVHCIGAKTLEDRVFEDYVAFVREKHADAPAPAVFRDRELFDMAREGMTQQGEETFLKILNKHAAAKTGLAGRVAQKEGAWTREKFEAAASSSDPMTRHRLFTALTSTHYPAFVKGGGHFLDFAPGLAALAAHAKSIGYDGVLLLLDEVILWLARLKSDETNLATEIQKISSLVETAKHPRAIPIVSLLARQRGLRELLGEGVIGATWAAIDEQLAFWKERFNEIELPDSEFPQILRERILRPKNDAARRAIEQAFEDKRRSLSTAEWDLLRSGYTEEDFQRVYPFSPALIDVLVRLSSALQRERTAMRIVTDLLVNHVGDQPVGSIVPLGDLYDLLALEETRDELLNQRFHGARLAYKGNLLPAIQKKHGTGTIERCQRLRDGAEPTLGCSTCGEQTCRNDNRIAKTLILAALTPDVPTVAQLDARKLAHLNHGVIRSPLPNGAVSRILSMVKEWQATASTGSVSVGTGENPTISLRLDAVDLEPILRRADAVDGHGARQGLLRRLLLEELGLESKDPSFTCPIEWRGSRRKGQIQFANVRTLPLSALEVPQSCEWQVVIDFPFDERNKSPQDDYERVKEFTERDKAAWTMVWLPSFFSEQLNDTLGKLVRVDHIDGAPDDYLRSLSGADRERAKSQIHETRRGLRERVIVALEVAYGVRSSSEAASLLDQAAIIEPHTYPLHPNAKEASFAKHSLKAAIDEQVDALLSARYPGHPNFKKTFTGKTAGRVAELLGQLIEEKANRLHVKDKADLLLLREVAEPFLLAQVSDEIAVLRTDVLERIKKAGQRAGVDEPTVSQVAAWAEGDRPQGLDPVARDLLVDVYARWRGATIFDVTSSSGSAKPVDPIPYGKLSDAAVLRLADLPSPEAWASAVSLASSLWGSKLGGRALNAKNLSQLRTEVDEVLPKWAAAEDLVTALETAWGQWGDTEASPRLTTARSSLELASSLTDQSPLDTVNTLASARIDTSPKAAQRSLDGARRVVDELARPQTLSIYDLVGQVQEPWARKVLDDLREALRADELNVPLLERLQALHDQASQGLRSRSDEVERERRRLEEERRRLEDAKREAERQRLEAERLEEEQRRLEAEKVRKADKKGEPAPSSGTVSMKAGELDRKLAELRAAWERALGAGGVIDVRWERRNA